MLMKIRKDSVYNSFFTINIQIGSLRIIIHCFRFCHWSIPRHLDLCFHYSSCRAVKKSKQMIHLCERDCITFLLQIFLCDTATFKVRCLHERRSLHFDVESFTDMVRYISLNEYRQIKQRVLRVNLETLETNELSVLCWKLGKGAGVESNFLDISPISTRSREISRYDVAQRNGTSCNESSFL